MRIILNTYFFLVIIITIFRDNFSSWFIIITFYQLIFVLPLIHQFLWLIIKSEDKILLTNLLLNGFLHSFLIGTLYLVCIGWIVFLLALNNFYWGLLILIYSFIWIILTNKLVLNNEIHFPEISNSLKIFIFLYIFTLLIRLLHFMLFPSINQFDISIAYYPMSESLYLHKILIASYAPEDILMWGPPFIPYIISNLFLFQGVANYFSAKLFLTLISTNTFPLIYLLISKISKFLEIEKIMISLLISISNFSQTFGNNLYTDWMAFLMLISFINLYETVQEKNQLNKLMDKILIYIIILTSYSLRKSLTFSLLTYILVLEIYNIFATKQIKIRYYFTLTITFLISLLLEEVQIAVLIDRTNLPVPFNHYTALLISLSDINILSNLVYYILSLDTLIDIPPNLFGVSEINNIISIILFFILIIFTVQLLFDFKQEPVSIKSSVKSANILPLIWLISLSPIFGLHLIFYALDLRYIIPIIPFIFLSSFRVTHMIMQRIHKRFFQKKYEYGRIRKLTSSLLIIMFISTILVNYSLEYHYSSPSNDPFRNVIFWLDNNYSFDQERTIAISNQHGSVYYYLGIKGINLDSLYPASNYTHMINLKLFEEWSYKNYKFGLVIIDNYLGNINLYNELDGLLHTDIQFQLLYEIVNEYQACSAFLYSNYNFTANY